MEQAEMRAAVASREKFAADAMAMLSNNQATPSMSWNGHHDPATSLAQYGGQLNGYDYSRMFPSFSNSHATPASSDSGASPFPNGPNLRGNGNANGTGTDRTPANGLDAINFWSWPDNLGQSQLGGATAITQFQQTAPTLEAMPWSSLSSSNDVSTVWSMDLDQSNTMQDTTIPNIDISTFDPYAQTRLGLGFDLDPLMGLNLTQALKHVNHHQPFSFSPLPAISLHPQQQQPTQQSHSQSMTQPLQSQSQSQSQFTTPIPNPVHPQSNGNAQTAALEAMIGIQPAKPAPSAAPVPAQGQGQTKAIDEVLTQAAERGTQLNEADFSQSARDYLLDLFFRPPRVAFGSEVWSEDQFRAKMALPSAQRPHPCLCFSMYTLAASTSYIPAVRALADSLYSIALQKLNEAVTAQDRLLDAINAAKGLGKWQFSRARPLEGFHLSNRANM